MLGSPAQAPQIGDAQQGFGPRYSCTVYQLRLTAQAPGGPGWPLLLNCIRVAVVPKGLVLKGSMLIKHTVTCKTKSRPCALGLWLSAAAHTA